MTKSALRQQFMVQRRALSADNVERQSQQITEQLFAEFFIGVTKIILHTFLPIVRQNEVNTWPIIHRIWQDFPSGQIAVSVADITTNRLTHHVFTPETPLIENRWGIPEPQPSSCTVINSEQIAVVLVPLLAFDKQGYRVGYGKGYYDRFLAECRPDCLKIGLSLFEPVECITDVELTDIRLDRCVTSEQVYFF